MQLENCWCPVMINGEIWLLKMRSMPEHPGRLGCCDHRSRTITINPDHAGQIFETLTHEIIHASLPHLPEDQVRATAFNITAVFQVLHLHHVLKWIPHFCFKGD